MSACGTQKWLSLGILHSSSYSIRGIHKTPHIVLRSQLATIKDAIGVYANKWWKCRRACPYVFTQWITVDVRTLNPVALYVSYPRLTVGRVFCVVFCIEYCAETVPNRAATPRDLNMVGDSNEVAGFNEREGAILPESRFNLFNQWMPVEIQVMRSSMDTQQPGTGHA
jgi:hypothetical protein